MKKGGLINELEEKIKANMEVIGEYEEVIGRLQHYNAVYDFTYNETYTRDWLAKHNMNNFDIINFRQSIIMKICHNNDLLDDYKLKIEKHINISNFLQRIYFFLQFYLKPYTVSEKTYLKYLKASKKRKNKQHGRTGTKQTTSYYTYF